MNALLEQMQAMQNLQLLGGNLGGNMGAIAAALAQNPSAAAAFLSNTPSKVRTCGGSNLFLGSVCWTRFFPLQFYLCKLKVQVQFSWVLSSLESYARERLTHALFS